MKPGRAWRPRAPSTALRPELPREDWRGARAAAAALGVAPPEPCRDGGFGAARPRGGPRSESSGGGRKSAGTWAISIMAERGQAESNRHNGWRASSRGPAEAREDPAEAGASGGGAGRARGATTTGSENWRPAGG